jgi:hypothetical protein
VQDSAPDRTPPKVTLRRAIRVWLLIFMVGLAISGATAFPLVSETALLAHGAHTVPAPDTLVAWIDRVHRGPVETGKPTPSLRTGRTGWRSPTW